MGKIYYSKVKFHCAFIYFLYMCMYTLHILSLYACVCAVWLTVEWKSERLTVMNTKTDGHSARVRAASLPCVGLFHMGAQLKPHDYSVVLPPALISPLTDVNVTGCRCFYVPSNDVNSTAAASGTGDITAEKKPTPHLCSSLCINTSASYTSRDIF